MENTIVYQSCKAGHLHDGEPLSRLCIDDKCTNRTIICAVCEELSHKNHHTVPLRQFLRSLTGNQVTDGNDSFNPLIYAAEIERCRNTCLGNIRARKREITQLMINIENRTLRYFDNLETMFQNLVSARGPIQRLADEFERSEDLDPLKIKQELEEVLKIFQIDGSSKNSRFNLQDRLEGFARDAHDKSSRLNTGLTSITNQVERQLRMTAEQFDIGKIVIDDKPVKYSWSNTLKGHKVKITDNMAEQTGSESSGQRFALIEPALNQGTLKKRYWAIRMKKFASWIGVGIALQNVIKGANYHFNYTTLGHGSYLISSNGYSWSHSAKEFNSTYKSFQFAVNDIVYMEYDPFALKLRFRKNDSNEEKDKFELAIEAAPPGDNYFACANLCTSNDVVEIVYPGKPLS